MTEHINTFYVIISYFLCCKRQTKYKKIHIVDSSIEVHENYTRNKPRAVSNSENPMRANEGKPREVALKTSPQHHFTKQQRYLVQSVFIAYL